MGKFKGDLKSSALELRRLRALTFCAVMGALGLALEAVASLDLGPYISIGFSGLPNQIVDLTLGPVTGGLFAGVMDVLKYFVKPSGAFFFGFTFDAMLAAFIYGCSYYKRPISLTRVLVTKLIVTAVVNMGFATLWISMLYDKAFFVLLPTRAIKDLLVWPVESVIFYTLAVALEDAGIFRLLRPEE